LKRSEYENLHGKGIRVLDVSVETAEIFGEIKVGLSKKSTMIPLNDMDSRPCHGNRGETDHVRFAFQKHQRTETGSSITVTVKSFRMMRPLAGLGPRKARRLALKAADGLASASKP
jgi:hypothetical protein